MSAAASRFIHLARWLAAFFVVLDHVATVFVSVPDIMTTPHGALAYVWWFFTPYAFAHEAVVVFFVLSGFLVGGAVLERRKAEHPWLGSYIVDRLVRIYVVLLPALAITVLCDSAGRAAFSGGGLYDLLLADNPISFLTFLPSVLSLQGLWFEPFGTNDPLWSLGMEVWFYLLFPLLLLPWLRAYPRHGWRVAGLAFALVFLMSLPSNNYTRFGFCLWGIGVLARTLQKPFLRQRWVSLLVFATASIAVRLAIRPPLIMEPEVKYCIDAIEALLFANLLLTLRFDASEGFRATRCAIHERLAGFSYTLYAVHAPIIVLIASAIGGWAGSEWRLKPATPAHYGVAIGMTALVCVFAWAMSRLTEARTAEARRALKRILLPASASQPDRRPAAP